MWFRNYYQCARCSFEWPDEWSCMCDDDCPECGARHMSPYDSDDLTVIVGRCRGTFVVLRSPDSAEHHPDYEEIGRFATREEAAAALERATPSIDRPAENHS